MTPKNKTLMWLGVLFLSLIGFVLSAQLSNGLLVYPSYFGTLLGFGMTINSSIKYFKERKTYRSYSYAEQKGWDKNSYGKSGSRKAGESLSLFGVISITGIMLMANYGYLDLDPNAPNDRLFLVAGDDVEVIEQQIHELINQQRNQNGLKSLSSDEKLVSIARAHSQDMANRDYFSHHSPEGESFSDRFAKDGYNCKTQSGENLYYSEGIHGEGRIADSAVSSLMDSPGHQQNILTKDYRSEGIGVAVSFDKVYVTQNFC